MSTTRLQKRSSSRTSVSSSSTPNKSKSNSQNSVSKRAQSPKSKSTGKRVQIGTDSYFGSTLSPMAPG